ncbi:MAG: hypothetical protein R2834_19170 [Rhodothermales bacterium]
MLTVFALFAIIAVPILFFMLTWVVVTACRIFFPEKPLLVDRDAAMIRRHATREGESIPVGIREIREDQRYLNHQGAQSTYHFSHGDSEGLPLSWFEDLHDRRN